MTDNVDDEEHDDDFVRPTAREYSKFFDEICDFGLGEPRYRETIATATLKQCRTLYGKVCHAFPLGDHATANNTTTLGMEIVASDSLSGGPYPCSSADCQSASADVGARFAALYADHIIVRDPLGTHGEDDRERLLAAIEVMYAWRPLFEAGIASHVVRICTHCAASRLRRLAKLPADVPRLTKRVERRFAKAAFMVRRIDRRTVYVTVDAPNTGLAHGSSAYEYEGDQAKPFLDLLGRKETARVPVARARACGVLKRVAEPMVHEFLMQQLHRATRSPSTHYASNIQLELELANDFAPVSIRWPRSLLEALTHTVPVVGHASVRDIVRYRLHDPPAFQRYRSHVRSVAEQTGDPKALLDAAQSLKSDFAGLEQALRASRSGLWKKARNELVLFGSIGIALAGAIGIHALLPALGGAALRTLGEAVKPRVPDDVQKHPLYFLWQLQQRA